MRKGLRALFVSVVLLLFAKKSVRKRKKKNNKRKSGINILSSGFKHKLGHKVKPLSDLSLLTCNSCVPAPGLGCRSGVRPLPPDGRRLGGTLARVGDAGAVLLVGVRALLAVAQPVSAHGVRPLCGLPVERSGAVCGHLLPLEPARQRRVGLEVEVPAAAVLLGDLLQPLLQVPAQLLLVHRAEQAPAHRLSALHGVHRRKKKTVGVWVLSGQLWSAQCCRAI